MVVKRMLNFVTSWFPYYTVENKDEIEINNAFYTNAPTPIDIIIDANSNKHDGTFEDIPTSDHIYHSLLERNHVDKNNHKTSPNLIYNLKQFPLRIDKKCQIGFNRIFKNQFKNSQYNSSYNRISNSEFKNMNMYNDYLILDKEKAPQTQEFILNASKNLEIEKIYAVYEGIDERFQLLMLNSNLLAFYIKEHSHPLFKRICFNFRNETYGEKYYRKVIKFPATIPPCVMMLCFKEKLMKLYSCVQYEGKTKYDLSPWKFGNVYNDGKVCTGETDVMNLVNYENYISTNAKNGNKIISIDTMLMVIYMSFFETTFNNDLAKTYSSSDEKYKRYVSSEALTSFYELVEKEIQEKNPDFSFGDLAEKICKHRETLSENARRRTTMMDELIKKICDNGEICTD